MQKDLLIAVKVANDFKMEAQKEMLKLSDKITELQRRRQSAAFTVHKGSSVILSKKNIQSWEDEAWQRLMLGCERGLFFSVLYFFLLLCFLKKTTYVLFQVHVVIPSYDGVKKRLLNIHMLKSRTLAAVGRMVELFVACWLLFILTS